MGYNALTEICTRKSAYTKSLSGSPVTLQLDDLAMKLMANARCGDLESVQRKRTEPHSSLISGILG